MPHDDTEISPLLTKEDVCRILGVKETWLNSEIQNGHIRHIRLGKKKFIRFREEHVHEYLESKERLNGAPTREEV